jgi:hypothetical protein
MRPLRAIYFRTLCVRRSAFVSRNKSLQCSPLFPQRTSLPDPEQTLSRFSSLRPILSALHIPDRVPLFDIR